MVRKKAFIKKFCLYKIFTFNTVLSNSKCKTDCAICNINIQRGSYYTATDQFKLNAAIDQLHKSIESKVYVYIYNRKKETSQV